MTQTVIAVHITHRHGSGTEVFSTKENATAYLANWAREWWHEIDSDTPAPDDDDEAIEQYFDGNDSEFYDWDEVQLDRCAPHPAESLRYAVVNPDGEGVSP